MRFAPPVAVALTLLVAGCSRDAEDAPEPGWTRLANGLRVCIRPIEGATDVAVLTTFDIGSDHDPAGRSGLAHLVEHLYVTAAAGETKARTAEEWLARYAGRCAAQTASEGTTHHVVVAPSALDAEISDAAMRMSDLRIEQSDLDRERSSVLSQMAEARNVEASEAAFRLATDRLRPRPHGARRGGVEADVERISLDEARDRSRRIYAPVNARLVVAGAVDPVAAMALVESRFAALAPGERVPAPDECGPPQWGEVEVTSDAPLVAGFVRTTAVCVAYLTPPWFDDDAAAFHLFYGFAMKHAGACGLSYPSFADDVLGFQPRGEARTVAEVVSGVDDLVKRFASHDPTPEEIESVRAAADPAAIGKAASVMQESPDWVAALFAAEVRSRADTERVLESLKSLTQADLARFAAKWLAPERRVVVIVHGVANEHPPERPLPNWMRKRLEPPKAEDIHSIRVVVTWDEPTQTSHRTLGGDGFPDDVALEKAISAARDASVKSGKPEVSVVIEAGARVPWDEVLRVVNAVKRCGIDRIEFTDASAPTPPK